MDLISVIVPVYNVEKYLSECLLSLKNQTYKNIEIIMVNDGSTDGSANICREFCDCDNRFSLIEQANQGLGAARNAGIDRAAGKYLCFVDSDDLVHEDYIMIMYQNLIAYGADISMCGYIKFDDEEGGCPKDSGDNSPYIYNRAQLIDDLATTGPDNRSEPLVIVCDKLISADFFKHVRFPNKLHEDEFIAHEYILGGYKIVRTDKALYFYRQRSMSITGKNGADNFRHFDIVDAMDLRLKAFVNEDDETFKKILLSVFENLTIVYLLHSNKNNKLKSVFKVYPVYGKILFKHAAKLSLRQFIHYCLFLFSPSYFKKRYWNE